MTLLLRFQLWWHNICPRHAVRKQRVLCEGGSYWRCDACDDDAADARRTRRERLIAAAKDAQKP